MDLQILRAEPLCVCSGADYPYIINYYVAFTSTNKSATD